MSEHAMPLPFDRGRRELPSAAAFHPAAARSGRRPPRPAVPRHREQRRVLRARSAVARSWVDRVEPHLPSLMLALDDEHGRRWCAAKQLVAASTGADDRTRGLMTLAWMWNRLGGDRTPRWVPDPARERWAAMLTERTVEAIELARVASALASGPNDDWAADAAAFASAAMASGRPADAIEAWVSAVSAGAWAAAQSAAGWISTGDELRPPLGAAERAAAAVRIEYWRAADPALHLLTLCQVGQPG